MSSPRITHRTLVDAGEATDGVVVVVDVLRAFTVAALALEAGARAIRCVATVEEALAVRAANPGSLAMGERNGRPVPGFDLGNSPSRLASASLRGRLLVQRTSAGTQGLVAAAAVTGDLFGELLAGDQVDARPYVQRVRSADAARAFFTGDPDFPSADVAAAMRLDAVDFALRAEVSGAGPVLSAFRDFS